MSFSPLKGSKTISGSGWLKERRGKRLLKAEISYWKPPLLPIFLIQCKQRFPSDTRISLIWGKGSDVENRSGNRSRSNSPLSNEKSLFCRVPLRKGESKGRVYSHHTHGSQFLCTDFQGPDANQIVLKGPDGKDMEAPNREIGENQDL